MNTLFYALYSVMWSSFVDILTSLHLLLIFSLLCFQFGGNPSKFEFFVLGLSVFSVLECIYERIFFFQVREGYFILMIVTGFFFLVCTAFTVVDAYERAQ